MTVGDGVGTGKVYHYVNGKYDLHQRVYRMFDFKNGALAKYFYHHFSNHFYDRVMAMTAKTSVDSVRYEMISEMDIEMPSEKEQAKIIDYLDNLDTLITLHQREYEFIGRINFEIFFSKSDYFTSTWEQRKLGEIADIVRGASPRPIKDPIWFNDESVIGWLRISDVTEQDGRIHFLEQRLSEAGQEKTRVLNEPHLLLSIAATVGKPVINYVQTGVHDGFLIFLNPKFDQEFMFQWLEMFRPQWQKFGQPGSQVNLNSDLVKNKDIMLPSDAEQIKIGNFFKNLDNLITLHQRELEKLQNIKKSCLERMFV